MHSNQVLFDSREDIARKDIEVCPKEASGDNIFNVLSMLTAEYVAIGTQWDFGLEHTHIGTRETSANCWSWALLSLGTSNETKDNFQSSLPRE